jgi:pyruvate-ferredoxin/flavodoxin oxidoreductase
VLEYKAPDGTLKEFLKGENRYAQLAVIAPEASKELQEELEKELNERYEMMQHMATAPADK